ncbi:MAG: hypothetical protein Q9220_006514 [cf. Caloplaca sp. 1 TL-2023]
MVYVAFGIAIASLAYLYYAYQSPQWSTKWLRLRSGKPRPTVGNAPTIRLEEQSADNNTVEKRSKEKDAPDDVALEKATSQESTRPLIQPRNPQSVIPTDKPPANRSMEPTSHSNSPIPPPANPSMQPPKRPGPRLRPKAINLMPPPSPQTSSSLRPLPTTSTSLRPPPSAASTLRAPPSRSLNPSSTTSCSLAPTASTLPSSQRPSKKVLLEPGHSPLDWAHLTTNPPSSTYLRGDNVPASLLRVSPSLLRYHNGRKGRNAWGVWQGRVYNLTPYMKFHPGGVDELMKGAGREKDAERLFLEVHPWVNWEGLLGECMVGILVAEEDVSERKRDGGGLEDMD